MALVLRKTLEQIDERTLVPLTRVNVLIVNLHLLGLTEADRAKINIKKMYEFIIGIPLKKAVHRELKVDERLRKQHCPELDKRLEEQLIQYATSKDHQAICEFLNRFIQAQARQLNAKGVETLLKGFQQKINLYLKEKAHEADLIEKSQLEWIKYINLCEASESGRETAARNRKCITASKSTIYSIFAAILLIAAQVKNDDRLLYWAFLMAIGALYNKAISSTSPRDTVKKPEAKAIASATNFTALNESLRENLDAFALEFVQKEQTQKKKVEDEKTQPRQQNPDPRAPAPQFPQEERDPNKPLKNKHQPSEQPAPAVAVGSAKPKIDIIKDEKHGNIYIPLAIGEKLFCFFRYNKQEMLDRIQSTGVEASTVIGKVESSLFTCRINKAKSKMWGVTELDNDELEEFKDGESNPTHKVRIREDARVGAAVRTELTEWEEANSIEKVMSPRGKVKLHGW
jgi:hypothetical protein